MTNAGDRTVYLLNIYTYIYIQILLFTTKRKKMLNSKIAFTKRQVFSIVSKEISDTHGCVFSIKCLEIVFRMPVLHANCWNIVKFKNLKNI